jgi:hypothetical protein
MALHIGVAHVYRVFIQFAFNFNNDNNNNNNNTGSKRAAYA